MMYHFPTIACGVPLDRCKTFFENLREEQKAAGNAPWYPFESEEEWELAQWLMTSGLSQKKTDAYLKLKAVRTSMQLIYHAADSCPSGARETRAVLPEQSGIFEVCGFVASRTTVVLQSS
jgi:hypothetical protein